MYYCVICGRRARYLSIDKTQNRCGYHKIEKYADIILKPHHLTCYHKGCDKYPSYGPLGGPKKNGVLDINDQVIFIHILYVIMKVVPYVLFMVHRLTER